MANKISKEIDLEILTSLAMGQSGKEISERLGVSTAYISQLKNGKTGFNFHEDEISSIINNGDYSNILTLLNSSIVDKEELLKYVDNKFKECITQAKLWEYVHNKIMEDINATNIRSTN